MQILVRIVINAIALWAAASWVDGIELSSSLWQVLAVAIVFGVVNALLKPLFQLVSIPFLVLTLGLFTLVINALLLNVTDWLTSGLSVVGYMPSIWGGLIISVVSWGLSVISIFIAPGD